MKTASVSAGFRKRLKQQLPLLEQDGLIMPDQVRSISDRYRLDQLASESTRTLVMVIYTVGAFLIGIGVISFVAAHWTAIPRTLKVCLIFAAMLAAHGGGFYLWKVSRRSPALGHALIILGTLIFGANIGLMAQIFHVEGRWNGLFLPWTVGALVMAYAVASTPTALIAIITSFIWFIGGVDWGQSISWYYPFAAAAVFLPYCYWRRSAFTFAVTLLAIGIAAIVCSVEMPNHDLFIGLSFIAVGLLYTCLGLSMGGAGQFQSFCPPAAFLGFVAMTVGVYLASFQDVAHEWLYDVSTLTRIVFPEGAALLAALVAGILLIVPAVLRSRNDPAAMKILGAVIVSFGLFVIGSLTVSRFLFAMLANIALFALAATLIWTARDIEDRRLFWSGVVLVGLMVVSRTLEYETGLLVKAVVFTAGGIAVIASGVMFERFLKTRRIAHE